MFFAGDEFCNTQFGNNNPYCQDNEISWLDWSRLENHQDLFHFVSQMIAFRKAHPIIRGETAPARCGWPSVSLHNGAAWNAKMDEQTRQIGVLFTGRNQDDTADDLILLAVNSHWEAHWQGLPELPSGLRWSLVLHTACHDHFAAGPLFSGTGL